MLRCFFYIAISAVSIIYSQECQDISANYYGDCELQIGYGWDGDNCILISGCDFGNDQNSFFNTYEECDITCNANYSLGDLNGDSTINIIDIVSMINLILDNNYINSGDINNDNTMNVIDIVTLVNLILDNNYMHNPQARYNLFLN